MELRGARGEIALSMRRRRRGKSEAIRSNHLLDEAATLGAALARALQVLPVGLALRHTLEQRREAAHTAATLAVRRSRDERVPRL